MAFGSQLPNQILQRQSQLTAAQSTVDYLPSNDD